MQLENREEVENPKPRRLKKIILTFLIVTLIHALVFGLYSLLNCIFYGLISAMIIIFLGVRLVQTIIRWMVFPGSIKLMRRSYEFEFMMNRAKIMVATIHSLLQLVENIETQNSYSLIDVTALELFTIFQRISSMNKSYQRLTDLTQITHYQHVFFVTLSNLQTHLDKSLISTGHKTFSLWAMLQSNELLTSLKNICNHSNLNLFGQESKFQSETQRNDLKTSIMETIDQLNDILKIQELPFSQKWRAWYRNDTFGSLDYFKAELSIEYSTKEMKIKTKDNILLDGMMIYGKRSDRLKKDGDVEEGSYLTEGQPTIMFLNPNAGFYEFSKYSNEWIDFYWRKGINVFVWNYRGYGKSEGTPSSKNIQADAECVVDYLREEEKIGLLGTHGQSLGGMAACHVASKKRMDFLCADRTFSSVSDVAYHMMGGVCRFLVRLLSNYDVWTARNYSQASCYKVLAYDPKDNIISYLSSLKCGVSKQIARDIFVKDDYYQVKGTNYLKNTMGFCRETWRKDSTVDMSTRIFLGEDDQQELFQAFFRIVTSIRFMLEKKKVQSSLIQLSEFARNSRKVNLGMPLKQSTVDFDTTLDQKNILNSSELIQNIQEDERKTQASRGSENIYSQHNLNENQANGNHLTYLNSLNNESRDLSMVNRQDGVLKPIGTISLNNSSSNIFKYTTKLNDSHRNSQQFMKFFKSLFSLLDSYDAGGLTLLDVFYIFPQKQIFQVFQVLL